MAGGGPAVLSVPTQRPLSSFDSRSWPACGGCRRLQETAGGCRRLQEAAGGCTRLQEAAGGCGTLREAAGGCGRLREAAGSCGRMREAGKRQAGGAALAQMWRIEGGRRGGAGANVEEASLRK